MFKLPLRSHLHIFYGAEIITLQYCLNIHLALIYSCLIELCHSATWCHQLYILCKLPLRGHLHIFYGGNGVQSSLLGLNGAMWDISSSGASNPRSKDSFSGKRRLNFINNPGNLGIQDAGCIKGLWKLQGFELQRESFSDFIKEHPNFRTKLWQYAANGQVCRPLCLMLGKSVNTTWGVRFHSNLKCN